jgi:hypothetical protein
MDRNDVLAIVATSNDLAPNMKQASQQLALRMVEAVMNNNSGMKVHQAAFESRWAMEKLFIVPYQAAKSYGAAICRGVRNYVASLPEDKQPMAPDVAGKLAKMVYNLLGTPQQQGGFGVHAVPITTF